MGLKCEKEGFSDVGNFAESTSGQTGACVPDARGLRCPSDLAQEAVRAPHLRRGVAQAMNRLNGEVYMLVQPVRFGWEQSQVVDCWLQGQASARLGRLRGRGDASSQAAMTKEGAVR